MKRLSACGCGRSSLGLMTPQKVTVPTDQHGLPLATFIGPQVDTTCNGHYIDPDEERDLFFVLGVDVRKKVFVPIKTLRDPAAWLS